MELSSETARLDRTLRALQDRVRRQEEVLQQLRESSSVMAIEPSDDPAAQLRQLRTLQRAYTSMTNAAPFLPSPDSPIPSLLALRNTYDTIRETHASTDHVVHQLRSTEAQLERERTDLATAREMTTALQARTRTLESEVQERRRKPPQLVAREYMRNLERRRDRYAKETAELIQAFNNFVDVYLAPMLAREERGGPVVGDKMEQQQQQQQDHDEGREDGERGTGRQTRIEDYWAGAGAGAGSGSAASSARGKPSKLAVEEAAAEMRELTEDLLNKLVDGGGAGYVKLRRESAAARFLVRSMVAQFHPRDATRLRMVDFGKELDD